MSTHEKIVNLSSIRDEKNPEEVGSNAERIEQQRKRDAERAREEELEGELADQKFMEDQKRVMSLDVSLRRDTVEIQEKDPLLASLFDAHRRLFMRPVDEEDLLGNLRQDKLFENSWSAADMNNKSIEEQELMTSGLLKIKALQIASAERDGRNPNSDEAVKRMLIEIQSAEDSLYKSTNTAEDLDSAARNELVADAKEITDKITRDFEQLDDSSFYPIDDSILSLNSTIDSAKNFIKDSQNKIHSFELPKAEPLSAFEQAAKDVEDFAQNAFIALSGDEGPLGETSLNSLSLVQRQLPLAKEDLVKAKRELPKNPSEADNQKITNLEKMIAQIEEILREEKL